MDHEDPEASLGFLIEQVLGSTEDGYLVVENGNKRRGLRNWYRLNDQFEDFECFLSETQRKSYSLIHDWWTARYCDAGVSLANIIDIVDECGDIQDENEDPEGWTNASRHLALKRWPEPEAARTRRRR